MMFFFAKGTRTNISLRSSRWPTDPSLEIRERFCHTSRELWRLRTDASATRKEQYNKHNKYKISLHFSLARTKPKTGSTLLQKTAIYTARLSLWIFIQPQEETQQPRIRDNQEATVTRPGEAGRARDQGNLLNGSNRPPSNPECYDSCLALGVGGGEKGRREELNSDKDNNRLESLRTRASYGKVDLMRRFF